MLTSHFATANGIKLHYMEAGTGPLVVLLHGFPEFWYGWRKQIPVLSTEYRVVAVDMRGFNLSEKPEKISDYNIETLAADIASLIEALGEKSAIVVGHDWGAAVAWALAAFHPGSVRKLAILNVPHPNEMRRAFLNFNLSQWMKSWYIFFFQLPVIPEMVIGTEEFFKRIFKSMSPKEDPLSSEDLQKYVEAYSRPGAVRAAIAYYRAAFRQIFQRSAKPYPMINAPVLMLWGEQDKALGKELTLRTKEYCSNTFRIFYDSTSGHFVQLDNPDWVNEKLMAFFIDNHSGIPT